ncbi:hypothetical protein CsSME_00038832 [Camellia sinensis var. sinensis]
MDHTSLATHLKELSVSPIINPVLLRGFENTDDEIHDHPWKFIARIRPSMDSGSDDQLQSMDDGECVYRIRKQMLTRTKSFRRLPRFSLWSCLVFRLRLRLKDMRRL